MTEWEPGTDAELAMRDALRTDDQESYFRILAGVELLLPVSADALAGNVPLGWGTWSSGGRTHVLAFTSPTALQACLAEYAGSARRVPYVELAQTWPNLEWWLAVNPGLPIEGYLPAWFVAQLARGDLRLPQRPAQPAQSAQPGQSAQPAQSVEQGQAAQQSPAPQQSRATQDAGRPGQAVPAVLAPAATNGVGAPAHPSPSRLTDAGHPGSERTGSERTGPGGLPVRTPGAVLPSGLPARVPVAAQSSPDRAPAAAAPAPAAVPVVPAAVPVVPAAYRPPDVVPAGAFRVAAGHGGPADDAGPRRFGAAAFSAGQPAPAAPPPGGPLPRRPVTPPSERPTSMAAAAEAITGTRMPQLVEPAPAARPVPPVVAGVDPPARMSPAVASPSIAVDPDDDFEPANEVEQDLLNAADGGSTDIFLSTLLLATVLVPVGGDSRAGSTPGEPGFTYRTEDHEGDTFLVVFTSPDRLAEHHAEPVRTVGIRFFELIRSWPDPSWSFAVNPGSPVGAKLPGAQVVALASWATEAGLGADEVPAGADRRPAPAAEVPAPRSRQAGAAGQQPTIMQKTVPQEQVDYFLERGYDRVSGFVHRADEVAHLRTPAELHAALGLGYAGSLYRADAEEAHVLRWPAYRPSLYRIPYGGQHEQALRAMDGWVIERAPFRGNGFAPGEGRDVIAEFKVDSARLPNGAELWRLDADGAEELVAVFDGDGPLWRRVG